MSAPPAESYRAARKLLIGCLIVTLVGSCIGGDQEGRTSTTSTSSLDSAVASNPVARLASSSSSVVQELRSSLAALEPGSPAPREAVVRSLKKVASDSRNLAASLRLTAEHREACAGLANALVSISDFAAAAAQRAESPNYKPDASQLVTLFESWSEAMRVISTATQLNLLQGVPSELGGETGTTSGASANP